MEYTVLGWPDEGTKLALDYRAFSYAGKFVTANTGKAVALDADAEPVAEGDLPAADLDDVVDPDEPVVGAVAFSADRTDADTAWIRYVTVREDRRGEGIGPRLVAFTTRRLREREYDRVRIAVNNPFAYQALYRAGYAFTGEETGIAELVLGYPPSDRSVGAYRAGLDIFRERGPSSEERAFLDGKLGDEPPPVVDAPE